MGKGVKKILFIGHEASLSGAPVLLLNLLMLLEKEADIQVSLAIVRDGIFRQEYEKHFELIVLKGLNYSDKKRLPQRIISIIQNRIKFFQLVIKAAKADYIFSNTIVNGKVLKILALVNKQIITYVHELANVIAQYATTDIAKVTLGQTKIFAYPSGAVYDVLNKKYGIPETRLKRLDYYFPYNVSAEDAVEKEKWSKAFKERYGIQETSFLVVSMGYASERKGIDLFLDTCEYVVKRLPDAKFFWIGAFETPEIEENAKKRIEGDLSNSVFFTGRLAHNYYNLAPFDLFFLSSREDPYPLVAIEAALMKIPAVCFEPSGGIIDFVEDTGYIIPGFSTEKAGEQIIQLVKDKVALKESGEKAYQKAIELHVNEQRIIQQFKELLS